MYGFREAAIEKVPMVEAMVHEEYLVLQFSQVSTRGASLDLGRRIIPI